MRVIHFNDVTRAVGQEIGVSNWVRVDQDLIDRFADVTGDHQWIHVDVERATREVGSTVAHGFLTVSLMPAMVYESTKIDGVGRSLNYGFNKLRFTNVVRAGARIRLRQSLLSVEAKAGGLAMTRSVIVEIEGDPKPALVAEWTGIIFPAEQAEPASAGEITQPVG